MIDTYNKLINKIKLDLLKDYFPDNDPTYDHSLRVFETALRADVNLKLPLLALLHDVLEDTKYTVDDLKERYEVELFKLFSVTDTKAFFISLEALTRHEGETYMEYIGRVKRDRDASRVKIFDLGDNLYRCFNSGNKSLAKRYIKALKELIC